MVIKKKKDLVDFDQILEGFIIHHLYFKLLLVNQFCIPKKKKKNFSDTVLHLNGR